MRVHRSIRGGGGAWLGACVGRCGGDEPGVQESLWVEVEEPGWPGGPGAAAAGGPGAAAARMARRSGSRAGRARRVWDWGFSPF